jgi:N-acetylneuraminate synthase/N,N'-diacetyllegionaminate synthase
MVMAIRNIELAISGNGVKEPSESEFKNIAIGRKSIHLSKALPKGHIITNDDIIALRPGDGISPMEWNNVIGKEVVEDLAEYQKITWGNIK